MITNPKRNSTHTYAETKKHYVVRGKNPKFHFKNKHQIHLQDYFAPAP